MLGKCYVISVDGAGILKTLMKLLCLARGSGMAEGYKEFWYEFQNE